MGAYLSKPITKKESEDNSNGILSYGASSMQGWRISQEDAHNAILDYGDGMSFFAVYDGHGGQEVAVLSSKELPKYLKMTKKFEEKNYGDALVDAFLGFDAEILEPEYMTKLQAIAEFEEDDGRDTESEAEEVNNLVEMANMPLSDVLARYGNFALKAEKTEGGSSSSNASSIESDSTKVEDKENIKLEADSDKNGSDPDKKEIKVETHNGDQSDSTHSLTSKADTTQTEMATKEPKVESDQSDEQKNGIKQEVNGADRKEHSTLKQETQTNGEADSKCGKGKGLRTGKNILSPAQIQAMKCEQRELRKSSIETREDSYYQKFQEMKDISDDESSEEEEEGEDEGNREEYEMDSSDDEALEEEEEEKGCCPEEDESGFGRLRSNNHERPGFDSGCTACVALLHKDRLYVANVGDSRCVVSRGGKAIDLSVDHKPEDDIETERILNAGGTVTEEGRVNGGLNLSRALGDHSYKLNTKVTAEEQMISPLPDLQTLDIKEEDTFMIIACDGIWNSMTSQEACDFVQTRLEKQDKLSMICEQMFDFCLAPDKYGDGVGCDNMTCIIVRLKGTKEQSLKREAEEDTKVQEKEFNVVTKKVKLEETMDSS